MIFELGNYKLDIDVDRTRQFYKNENYEFCTCAGCRNFAKAFPFIPDAVQVFFQELGIDIGKPAELTAYVSRDGNMTFYDGFYHICGSILEGREPFIQIDERNFQLDERMTIMLTPDHLIYFTSKCGLVEKDFPAPVIQLEIQGNIPWVLNEPNPYHDPMLNKE